MFVVSWQFGDGKRQGQRRQTEYKKQRDAELRMIRLVRDSLTVWCRLERITQTKRETLRQWHHKTGEHKWEKPPLDDTEIV